MQRFTIIVYITLSRIYSINPYRGITFPSPIHHRPPYKYPLLITLNPERQKRNTRAPRPTHTRAGVTGAQRKREKRPTTHTYTHTRIDEIDGPHHARERELSHYTIRSLLNKDTRPTARARVLDSSSLVYMCDVCAYALLICVYIYMRVLTCPARLARATTTKMSGKASYIYICTREKHCARAPSGVTLLSMCSVEKRNEEEAHVHSMDIDSRGTCMVYFKIMQSHWIIQV